MLKICQCWVDEIGKLVKNVQLWKTHTKGGENIRGSKSATLLFPVKNIKLHNFGAWKLFWRQDVSDFYILTVSWVDLYKESENLHPQLSYFILFSLKIDFFIQCVLITLLLPQLLSKTFVQNSYLRMLTIVSKYVCWKHAYICTLFHSLILSLRLIDVPRKLQGLIFLLHQYIVCQELYY